MIDIRPKFKPVLDPDFMPAALWNKAYRAEAEKTLEIAVERSGGAVAVHETRILPHEGPAIPVNELHVERLIKFLLWQKGGFHITVSGEPALAEHVRRIYSPEGRRSFDHAFMGKTVSGVPMVVEAGAPRKGDEGARALSLGGHLKGCRIGFDLGGSDRKAAAVVDGKVVFSEEVVWDPYPAKDPGWHYKEINDSLKRAAAHLPRVDAIGGSAAGIYVDNEVRVASLFRGVPADLFESKVRRIFLDLRKEWNSVPFVVVNDGEVTALAGSMSLKKNAVLGVAMGTSEAAGYVDPKGNLTTWLNELAFAPIDYRASAPADEWSGDIGCGVQYFSQQAVGRLLPASGIALPRDMKLPEKLKEVQDLMEKGDPRARRIFESIGVYLGYAVAHYKDFYEFGSLLLLGRVMSGQGGELILSTAKDVLKAEFPSIHEAVGFATLSERDKRHGQAIAAASLPPL
ncbi:MAG: ROK family protein [Elusimicrobiota bacterium]